MPFAPLVLHIPHASRHIPDALREQYVISEAELAIELLRLTDAYTDELFAHPQAAMIRMPVSRLVVDAERYPDDECEPMAARGMGMVYTHTSKLTPLRRALSQKEREQLRKLYYEPHHRSLHEATREAIDSFGYAVVVDCHSFPSDPLPCDVDQSANRPDVCLGVDDYHTPEALTEALVTFFEGAGYSVEINRPYSGTLVPAEFHQKDKRVRAIMIEVNRRLYMNEITAEKICNFRTIKQHLQNALSSCLATK